MADKRQGLLDTITNQYRQGVGMIADSITPRKKLSDKELKRKNSVPTAPVVMSIGKNKVVYNLDDSSRAMGAVDKAYVGHRYYNTNKVPKK